MASYAAPGGRVPGRDPREGLALPGGDRAGGGRGGGQGGPGRPGAASYPTPPHHCWAWRLGAPPRERSSDAGEPAGTAGVPMLQVLRGAGLSDVLAVVVRWFGGTKLGKGGLARAYAAAVARGASRVCRSRCGCRRRGWPSRSPTRRWARSSASSARRRSSSRARSTARRRGWCSPSTRRGSRCLREALADLGIESPKLMK